MSSLHYKTFGWGEPVIILHGLFGMSDNWQSFAKKLAEHYMVFIVDQRDHGRSPHMDDFNYELLADDLADFMTAQGIHKAKFIGHSMGGKTIMQFAENYQSMIEKMVVVDIGPKAYEGGHQSIFEALFSVDLDIIESRKEVELLLSKKIEDRSVIQFLMKNLSRQKTGGFRWKMNLELLYKNYDEILAEIRFSETVEVETLFVRGSRSGYISDSDIEEIRDIFDDVHFVTVEDAGHWVHADKPEVLLDAILSFFNVEL